MNALAFEHEIKLLVIDFVNHWNKQRSLPGNEGLYPDDQEFEHWFECFEQWRDIRKVVGKKRVK